MGQTIFVKIQVKTNQSGCLLLLLLFIFKITHCIHTQQSIKNLFNKPPFFFSFSNWLYSAPKTPVWETDFASVTWSSNSSVIGKVQELPSSFPFLFWLSKALKASDLWPTALLPSNSHLGKFKII